MVLDLLLTLIFRESQIDRHVGSKVELEKTVRGFTSRSDQPGIL